MSGVRELCMLLRTFKNSVSALKKTQFVFLADISHFDPFQETNTAFLENRNKPQRRCGNKPMNVKQFQRKATRSFETSVSTQRRIATFNKTENLDYTVVLT
jgi:hypothetical protein